jgi:hypothetical protein
MQSEMIRNKTKYIGARQAFCDKNAERMEKRSFDGRHRMKRKTHRRPADSPHAAQTFTLCIASLFHGGS